MNDMSAPQVCVSPLVAPAAVTVSHSHLAAAVCDTRLAAGFPTRARPEFLIGGGKTEDPKAENGSGVLGERVATPSPPARGSGERCELLQRSLGRSPDRPKVFHYFRHSGWPLLNCGLSYSHWWARLPCPSLAHAQWLKLFCEAGGSPDEARLEQTPYPFQPH